MAKDIVEIQGFSELQRKIKLIEKTGAKRKEVLNLLRQASDPTVKAAQREAPINKTGKPHIISGKRTYKVVQPGNLKKSIGKIVSKRNKVNAVLAVGPRSKGRKYDGWYGAMVHGGTIKQVANPFMDRAYKATKGKVTADAEKRIARNLQKHINKIGN